MARYFVQFQIIGQRYTPCSASFRRTPPGCGISAISFMPMHTSQLRSQAPIRDEWGVSDPQRAGMPAVIRAVQEGTGITGGAETRGIPPAAAGATAVSTCRFCGEALTPGRRQCARCSNEIASVRSKGDSTPDADVPMPTRGGAVYMLEFPTRCPQCSVLIRTFRVFRLVRTQVSFTSTLPRKGYVIVCPECDGLLSTELSGLI